MITSFSYLGLLLQLSIKRSIFSAKKKEIMALGNQQPEIYKTMVQHLGKKLKVFQTKLLADRN